MPVGPDSSLDLDRAVFALWGKSPVDGSPAHLLIQHLYDTAAVAELLWDRHLPMSIRQGMDTVSTGAGRQLFAFLAGIHDIGKATPIFQAQCVELVTALHRAGLGWGRVSGRASVWHHTRAGAAAIRRIGQASSWPAPSVDWIWPQVAGHHGRVPNASEVVPKSLTSDHGDDRWEEVRRRLFDLVASATGLDPASAFTHRLPPRGIQLAVLGYIVMADWVTSNREAFPPVWGADLAGMELARRRASTGWDALGLGRGWLVGPTPAGDPVRSRFDKPARPLQSMVVEVASQMGSPGILVVEAPMGEGKTEAALTAAEVLARRFGARGVFVGMPTQATSDPMLERVQAWSNRAAPGTAIALLHGKRMFNPAWRELLARVRVMREDASSETSDGVSAVADWFLGRKRGLLSPIAVGTVDNLLLAGARTTHVMLRHAGLAQKVVILDEVHAASAYMAQFLGEALRWLASCGVTVILLTATLPPALRTQLVAAYLEGALEAAGHADPGGAAAATALPPLPGYPGAMAAWVAGGAAVSEARATRPWRAPTRIAVERIDSVDAGAAGIADLLEADLADGGCVLVIRNTVDSAQRTYAALRHKFGGDVGLLHARLMVGERAARTARELAVLGPGSGAARPRRRILVATQVAEQSFDADADLLVSDIAPIDLLLQRAGRLHRHARAGRPARMARPRLVVTGMCLRDGETPAFGRGSVAVYREHRLLRAAALVLDAGDGWEIPTAVPGLVSAGYGSGPVVPSAWAGVADIAATAEAAWLRDLEAMARQGLLSPAGHFAAPTLAGLHRLGLADVEDDPTAIEGIVREGEQAAELVLVRTHDGGDLHTVGGRPLTEDGRLVADDDAVQEALASLLRFPGRPDVTAAARALVPPTAFASDPLLRGLRVVTVDDGGCIDLGRGAYRYDEELGLVAEATAAELLPGGFWP